MGIQCRIIRNKEGKVSYVEAPNGERSQLYDDAVATVGEEGALDVILIANTPSFIEEVKNPRIIAFRKELADRINSIPTTNDKITLSVEGIPYDVDLSTMQMVQEDLGNGETLITFKADLTNIPVESITSRSVMEWLQPRLEDLADEYILKHGNRLDPDEVRTIFYPVGYNTQNVPTFREAEKLLTRRIYMKMLDKAESEGNKSITFLTGTAGSGKTVSTQNMDLDNQGVVYDSAFSHFSSIDGVLGIADGRGFKTTVIAVYNDPVTAFTNTINRARRIGRVVGLGYFIDAFTRGANKIQNIRAKYPNTEIVAINNSGNSTRPATIEEAEDWSYDLTQSEFNELINLVENEINEFTESQLTAISEQIREDKDSTIFRGDKVEGLIQRIEDRLQQIQGRRAKRTLAGEGSQGTSGGRRLAPNGQPSNLTEAQYHQVRTPDFMRWSKNWDDVVKDKNGEPQIHYHGTSKKFTVFSSGKGVEFFTPDINEADRYRGGTKDSTIMELFVRTEKHLDTSKEIPPFLDKFLEENIEALDEYMEDMFSTTIIDAENEDMLDDTHGSKEINWKTASKLERARYVLKYGTEDWQILEYPPLMELLKEQGYTSFATKEGIGNIGVFTSNQAKSAVENIGTYDNTNPDIRFSIGVHDETGFITPESMVDIVAANNPTYLASVINHIATMSERLRNGDVGIRDIAKAYLISVSSTISSAQSVKSYEARTGRKVPNSFTSNGQIRPESGMAFFLQSEDGKILLDKLESGGITREDLDPMLSYVIPFGVWSGEGGKVNSVFHSETGINLKNLNEIAEVLKKGISNEAEIFEAVGKLKGISEGKIGFVAQFLGIGSRGVVDAREISAWLTGKNVNPSTLTPAQQKMRKDLLSATSKKGKLLRDEIFRRMEKVAAQFGIPKQFAQYLGHHMIWDAIGKEQTTHEEIYNVMRDNAPAFDSGIVPMLSETPSELLQGLVDRLKSSGLAKEVNIVSEAEIKKALQKGGHKYQQGINGFAIGDVVYINKNRARLDTPIHEFGHLWNSWMQQNAPEIYNKGIDLIKAEGQEYINIVKRTQPKLKGEAIYEEALAQAIGDNGALLLGETQKASFLDWLRDAWNAMKGALGLANTSLEEFQNLTLNEFAKRAATDLMSGQALSEMMNSPQGTVGAALTATAGTHTPSTSFKDVMHPVDFVYNLAKKTLDEVVKQYEGRVFGITSDATGVKYDDEGHPVWGGAGFTAIKENVDGKVGFASLDEGSVATQIGKMFDRYGANQKVAVLIMIQNSTAMLPNSYGSDYLSKALRTLKEQRPNEYETLIETLILELGENASIRKNLKKDGKPKELAELLRNVDKYTTEEFTREFINDTSFNARTAIMDRFLIKHDALNVGSAHLQGAIALRELGFTQFDYIRKYSDENFYTDEMIMQDLRAGKGSGGFFVAGFEFLTPERREDIPQMIKDVRDRGVTHPIFKSKVPSTGNHWFLDGRYGANENFGDFSELPAEVYPEGTPQRTEMDAIVRATHPKESSYTEEGRKLPFEERGYKHLKDTIRKPFKVAHIIGKRPDLYTLGDARVAQAIAKSEHFSPVSEDARAAMVRRAASETELPFVRFSVGDLTQGSLSGLLMRGKWGTVTGENPDAKQLSEAENAARNKEAVSFLEARGYETTPIKGKYGNEENSFLVPNLTEQDALDFAIKFGQDSVATDKGLIYRDGQMNPRNKREDSQGGTYTDNFSTIEFDGKPFSFAIGYDLSQKVDAGKLFIKTVEQIDAETKSIDRGSIPHLDRDGEGNYVFYHWSSKERNEIDPSKSGSNPNNITSSGESSAISKVGGVAMFYTKRDNKESGVGNYGHLVKVPMDRVYDMNKDPDNLLPVARARFEKKYPNLAFDGNHQAAFITQIANEKGYDMAVIKWGEFYRAQTTKKMIPVEKEIVEGNVVKSSFTDYSSGKPKFSVGFMQTKETPQGEQVKLSNVDDQIQGKGVGTEMYKKKATKNVQEGKSLVADENSKGAEGIWNKMRDAGVVEPVSMGDKVVDRVKLTPDSFDVNGEPNVNDVIQFIQSKNYEGQTLSNTEVNEVRNVMLGTTFESSDDLFRALQRGFTRNGVYNPSEDSLMATGLYSRVEARRLLDNEEAQLKAYEMMHKIKNSDTIPNVSEIDNSYITITSDYNSLGTLKKANPFLNEKAAREVLGGIKDETLFSNQAEANDMEFASSKFEELSALTKVPRIKVDGTNTVPHTNIEDLRVRLQETLTLPPDGRLVNNLNYVLDIPNNVWNMEFQNVREILNEIEKKAVGIGLDLSNLNETSYDKRPDEVKSLLNAVRNFAVLQNESTFEVLLGEYVTFFDIAEKNNMATVDVSKDTASKTLRYVKTGLDSYTMFTTYGLLPLGNNLYQKVNADKSYDEVVDIIYQHALTGQTILPSSVFEGYDLTNIENEEFIRQDIANYATEMSKSVENSSSYDPDTLRKMVLFSAYFKTKLNNEQSVPSVESEMDLIENYPANAEYLTTDFIADFNKSMLREKVRNSEKYNMFYKHFDITEDGIELVNTDPITMNEIQEYLTSDLINHFRLKKRGINLDAANETANEAANEAVLRNYYTNFPEALPLYRGTYQMDNGLLITNTNPQFLRVDEGAFEYVESIGAKALYAPLNTNVSPYKIYSPSLAAPTLGDTSKFNTSQGVKADKKINNLYTKSQGEELTNEIDNC